MNFFQVLYSAELALKQCRSSLIISNSELINAEINETSTKFYSSQLPKKVNIFEPKFFKEDQL